VLPHCLGNRLPWRIGREPRQLLDRVSHRALLRKSKAGYFEPSRSCTRKQPPLRSDSKDVAVYHDKSQGRGHTRIKAHAGSRTLTFGACSSAVSRFGLARRAEACCIRAGRTTLGPNSD
jgi:hypothetical protein